MQVRSSASNVIQKFRQRAWYYANAATLSAEIAFWPDVIVPRNVSGIATTRLLIMIFVCKEGTEKNIIFIVCHNYLIILSTFWNHHISGDDACKEKRKNSAYYISVGSTSQVINLEGNIYQLECLFTQPMQM